MMKHYDIVIVGGGAVGLSLLLALSQRLCATGPLKILVLESRRASKASQQINQDRSIVLSLSSQKLYKQLNCWEAIESHCTPISSIQVSVQGQYGTSSLQASELLAPALGYVISLYQLEAILAEACAQSSAQSSISMGSKLITCEHENAWLICYEQAGETQTIKADLLIGADGADSLVRTQNKIGLYTKDYGHQAIIGTVSTQAHHNQAFERFTAKGAIAFLPLRDNRSVFIWTLPSVQIADYLAKTDYDFVNLLQTEFGYRLGKLSDLRAKTVFPLKMTQATCQGKIKEPVLLMGTAALSLHPIGAQGLNLSLRNIAVLSKGMTLLCNQSSIDYQKLIGDYLVAIQSDQRQTAWVTDNLASNVAGGPFPTALRALGLLLFDSLPPLRRAFTQTNMGLRVI